jgi:hypothetical protein
LSVRLGQYVTKCDCFVVKFMVVVSSNRLAYNGLRLCEEADFGALNCHYTTKVDAR